MINYHIKKIILVKTENINNKNKIKKYHNKSVDSKEYKIRNKYIENNYEKNIYIINSKLEISNLIKADEKQILKIKQIMKIKKIMVYLNLKKI